MSWIWWLIIVNFILIGCYYLYLHFFYEKTMLWVFNLQMKRKKIVKDLWNRGKSHGEKLAGKVIK